jgi:hypothetical protein
MASLYESQRLTAQLVAQSLSQQDTILVGPKDEEGTYYELLGYPESRTAGTFFYWFAENDWDEIAEYARETLDFALIIVAPDAGGGPR